MKLMPSITRPCQQDWHAMSGDDKRRFCEHCQLHVHNLTAMSPREQRDLLSDRGERTCIAYVKGEDVTVVKPGTWFFLQRTLPFWRATAAALAAVIPLAISGCATTSPAPLADQHNCKQPERHAAADKEVAEVSSDKEVTAGVFIYNPPLWRRIFVFWDP